MGQQSSFQKIWKIPLQSKNESVHDHNCNQRADRKSKRNEEIKKYKNKRNVMKGKEIRKTRYNIDTL